METIEYAGPNGYTIMERFVLSDVEKMARENTKDVLGIHRAVLSKSHGSKRMLGFNPKHIDSSNITIISMTDEYKERLEKRLEEKRNKERI